MSVSLTSSRMKIRRRRRERVVDFVVLKRWMVNPGGWGLLLDRGKEICPAVCVIMFSARWGRREGVESMALKRWDIS